MQITGTNQQLKVTWPRYPRNVHQEIIRRLKLISGAQFDKAHACWWVPAAQGDKLLDSFPKASYDVDAIWACTDAAAGRAGAFYASLVSLGVKLKIVESGAIVGLGDNVSPLLQELIDARTPALLPLVRQAQGKTEQPRQRELEP